MNPTTKTKKQKKPITYYLGTFLMVFAVLSLLFIYYPYIATFLFPPKLDQSVLKHGLYVQVPKIKAQAKIIKNVDPFNKTEYRAALKKGVAHAKGTSLPWQKGMVYLFAHSSDYPWEISRYNTIFLRLNELNKGDLVQVFNNGKKYDYKVYDKKIVSPSQVEYLQDTGQNELILQTCWPIGTDFQRLLIFARPVN